MSASLAVLLAAQAIVSPPAAPAAASIQPPPPVAADGAAVARWQHDNAVGKALRGLQADGVDLGIDGVENVAGNPIGGARQGRISSSAPPISISSGCSACRRRACISRAHGSPATASAAR